MSVRIGESSWKDSWREISSSSLDMVLGTLLGVTLLGLVLGRRHPDIPSSLNHSEICDLNSPPACSLMHKSKFVFTKEGLCFFFFFLPVWRNGCPHRIVCVKWRGYWKVLPNHIWSGQHSSELRSHAMKTLETLCLSHSKSEPISSLFMQPMFPQ